MWYGNPARAHRFSELPVADLGRSANATQASTTRAATRTGRGRLSIVPPGVRRLFRVRAVRWWRFLARVRVFASFAPSQFLRTFRSGPRPARAAPSAAGEIRRRHEATRSHEVRRPVTLLPVPGSWPPPFARIAAKSHLPLSTIAILAWRTPRREGRVNTAWMRRTRLGMRRTHLPRSKLCAGEMFTLPLPLFLSRPAPP